MMSTRQVLACAGTALKLSVSPALTNRLLLQWSSSAQHHCSAAHSHLRSISTVCGNLKAPLEDVIVPSAGESITEGTISAVLKQAGQAVSQDEVVLQVDTDKVTIDVKAPASGVLQAVTVAEGDAITMGQVVATLDTEAAAAAAATPQAAQPATSTSSHSRQPSIRFPLRRTPEGLAISALPLSQQQQYLQASAPVAEQAAGQPATPAAAPSQSPAPGTGKVSLKDLHHIPRRTLTEREMEVIMLGGADP